MVDELILPLQPRVADRTNFLTVEHLPSLIFEVLIEAHDIILVLEVDESVANVTIVLK